MTGERNPIIRIRALLGSTDDAVARLAAPLWARVGRALGKEDLQWARSIGGEELPELLLQSLVSVGALSGELPRLNAAGVSSFLSALIGAPSLAERSIPADVPRLLWTLPTKHSGSTVRGTGLKDALLEIIRGAKSELFFIAPYIDPYGVGELLNPLLGAFGRGVELRILTHDALNLSSVTSRALEVLRREAERVSGKLTVYSGENGQGEDRALYPLLHAKLFIVDRSAVLLGSANLTSYAFSSNFEAAVFLGKSAAEEAQTVVETIIAERLAYLAFSTIRP